MLFVHPTAEVAGDAFIGPQVCFTNDVLPRAITPQGTAKSQYDWCMATRRASGDMYALVGGDS
jgi:hypothetical protein